MQKMWLLGAAALAVLAFSAYRAVAQNKEEAKPMSESKVLIAYYSYSGNTKEVAEAIQKETGGDLFEIKADDNYPKEYREMTEQVKKELASGYRPQLTGKVDNMAQYDVVFVGSPCWWGTITPQVSSFLESYDLSGKKVVPFITHGGGGVSNTVRDLTAQCKGCKVSSEPWVGYGSRTFGVSGWLKDNGFGK